MMTMRQEYDDFLQVYVMDSHQVRQEQQEDLQQQSQEHNNDNSRLRRRMRRSQFQLLFWSKFLLCWLSLGILLILFVWHSVSILPNSRQESSRNGHVAMLQWSDSNEESGEHPHPSFLRSSRMFLHRHYSSASSSSPMKRESYILQKSEDHSTSAFSVPSARQPSYQYFRMKQEQEKEVGTKRYGQDASTEEDGDTDADENSNDNNGDDHNDDIEDPDSQQQSNNNPAVYGWTPEAFPNPMTNPIRCAIAYLPEFLNHPPPDDSSSPTTTIATNSTAVETENRNSSSIPDNGQMLSPLQLTPEQEQQQQQEHPLRLCDPDWVLGGVYLEQVAFAMNNFTNMFGRQHFYNQLHHQSSVVPDEEMNRPLLPWVDLAIATARKMDLQAVLRDGSYYAYEDDDDMVNDAAQYFARGLHDAWWPATSTAAADDDAAVGLSSSGDEDEEESGSGASNRVEAEHGILLFLSIQDRVCFISTGAAIASILPWWRLDHIVTSMKPALRERDYGGAVLMAIQNLEAMLESGPPSLADRLHDFCARFGVVILFATFTFVFGAWGEYRDRRKRFQFAEERSKFKGEVDRQKARLLQQGYKTSQCPICLESFCTDKAEILSDNRSSRGYGSTATDINDQETVRTLEDCDDDSSAGHTKDAARSTCSSLMGIGVGSTASITSVNKKPNTDSYGIPLYGADGKRIKLLRCGHIFCESCWRSWVHSGCGNPCNCPVCRQDIGRAPRQSISRISASRSRPAPQRADPPGQTADNSDEETAPNVETSTREPNNSENDSPLAWGSTHPNFDSVSETRLSTSVGTADSASNGGGCVGPDERRPLLS